MWNDHLSIMKPAYFIIWFSFNNNFRFSIKWYSGPNRLYSINMWSTPAVWKEYNKMVVLHFFLVKSTLIYTLFSLVVNRICHSKNRGLLKITPTFPLFRGFLVLSLFFLRLYCLGFVGRGGVCLISCSAPISKSIKLKPFFYFLN